MASATSSGASAAARRREARVPHAASNTSIPGRDGLAARRGVLGVKGGNAVLVASETAGLAGRPAKNAELI